MKQPVLEKDLLVKTHDVTPGGFTRALLPNEYFSALKKQFKGHYKVKVLEKGHDDMYWDEYGSIKVGN